MNGVELAGFMSVRGQFTISVINSFEFWPRQMRNWPALKQKKDESI